MTQAAARGVGRQLRGVPDGDDGMPRDQRMALVAGAKQVRLRNHHAHAEDVPREVPHEVARTIDTIACAELTRQHLDSVHRGLATENVAQIHGEGHEGV